MEGRAQARAELAVLERYTQHMAEKPTRVGLSFLGHYLSTDTWGVASGVRIILEIPHAGQTCGADLIWTAEAVFQVLYFLCQPQKSESMLPELAKNMGLQWGKWWVLITCLP